MLNDKLKCTICYKIVINSKHTWSGALEDKRISINLQAIFSVRRGGVDNLENFDLVKNHLTIGSDHKINDFCFMKFISMKLTPHQAQKTIFHRFEQCGISLDMFEKVK